MSQSIYCTQSRNMDFSLFPSQLDGADVRSYGLAKEPLGLSNETEIVCLALAQYADPSKVYLFACDEAWHVVGDTIHDSLEQAKAFAQYFYAANIEWIDR